MLLRWIQLAALEKRLTCRLCPRERMLCSQIRFQIYLHPPPSSSIYTYTLQLTTPPRPLQLLRLILKILNQLPNRQIEHNILTPPRNPRAHHLAIHLLRDLALSRPRIPVPTKKQHRRLRAFIEDHTRLGFCERGETTEFGVRFGFTELRHLVEELFDPGLQGFELGAGFGEAVADDGLFD
jgi:hypothetical protein